MGRKARAQAPRVHTSDHQRKSASVRVAVERLGTSLVPSMTSRASLFPRREGEHSLSHPRPLTPRCSQAVDESETESRQRVQSPETRHSYVRPLCSPSSEDWSKTLLTDRR
ncbi:hypothetical protein QQG55_44745 [Brugia pahangi]